MKFYLSENIKGYRCKNKLTQAELAQILGVSPQAVSKWENHIAYPDIFLLPYIAKAIGVTLDTLLLSDMG